MSSLKELRTQFLKSLSSRLINLGFDKKIYGQSFWKHFKQGRGMFHITFINHPNDFDITTSISVRFDELEEMINKNDNLLTEKEKRNTSTIGVELGNLTQGEQKRWTITNENDIDMVVDDVYQMVEEFGIPYIDEFSNVENVFKLCLRDDKDVWVHAPFDYKRAINAVGLAKLLNKNEEIIRDIIQSKMKYLQEREDYGLPLFQKFIQDIK